MSQWIKFAADSSAEQPSVLLPAIYDIIWGGLSFIIVLVLFSKFVMPRMREITAERTEKIEGGLARAEKSQAEAAELLAQYREALDSANKEASDIRAAAQAERIAIIDEAKKAAAEAIVSLSEPTLESALPQQPKTRRSSPPQAPMEKPSRVTPACQDGHGRHHQLT